MNVLMAEVVDIGAIRNFCFHEAVYFKVRVMSRG
jgi:hypothetical protein